MHSAFDLPQNKFFIYKQRMLCSSWQNNLDSMGYANGMKGIIIITIMEKKILSFESHLHFSWELELTLITNLSQIIKKWFQLCTVNELKYTKIKLELYFWWNIVLFKSKATIFKYYSGVLWKWTLYSLVMCLKKSESVWNSRLNLLLEIFNDISVFLL